MRVLSGRARNTPLKTVPDNDTRPILDRVKKSLFSILDAAGVLPEAKVLDLYAGTGVQGIEALSRGASFAVFVERRADAAALLRENLIKTKFTDQAEVVCGNVGDYLRRTAAAGLPPFDLCLFDPPFAFSLSPETRTELEQLLAATGTILNAHGLLVLRSERQCTPPTPEGLILKRHWTDGPHSLFFYKKNS